MEVLGGAAAIVQLATVFSHLTKEIRKSAKAFRHAKKELTKISDDISIFSASLTQFNRVTADTTAASFTDTCELGKLQRLIRKRGKDSEKELTEFANNLRMLRNRHRPGVLGEFKIGFYWCFHQSDAQRILTSLSYIQRSMTLLLQFVMLNMLLKKVQDDPSSSTEFRDEM